MKKFTKQLILLTSATALCGFGYAAIDGDLGETSSGLVYLSATLEVEVLPVAMIQITGLEDFSWGTYTEETNLPPITISNICVYMSEPGTYNIDFESFSEFQTPYYPALMAPIFPSDFLAVTYSVNYTDSAANVATYFVNKSGLTASTVPGCTSSDFASLTLDPGVIYNQPESDGTFSTKNFTDNLTITVAPD